MLPCPPQQCQQPAGPGQGRSLTHVVYALRCRPEGRAPSSPKEESVQKHSSLWP